MGISLATIRTNVLNALGIDSTDLDTSGSTNLDLLINKSWWEIMDKLDFREKETSTTFPLVSGTASYDLADEIDTVDSVVFDALRSVVLIDGDGNHINLDEISIRSFEELSVDPDNNLAQPEFFLRESGTIKFTPTPDDAYDVVVYYLQILGDVPTAGPVIPQSWHEIIELGAIWRGHQSFRDYNSANEVRKLQLGLIQSALTNAAKEDKFNKNAGVEVLTRPTTRRY